MSGDDVVWVWREAIGWHEAPESALVGRSLRDAAHELRERGTPAHVGSRSVGPPDGGPVPGCCLPDEVDVSAPLTRAQERTLAEVRAEGSKTFSGRARGSLEALEARGLVTVEKSMEPRGKGNPVWVLRATAVNDEARP